MTPITPEPDSPFRPMSLSPPLRVAALKVTSIPEAQWETIGAITQIWKECALSKRKEYRSDPRLTLSFKIINIMNKYLTRAREADDEPWDRIYAYADEEEKIQALAFVQHERHFITLIATHPDNISHPVNDTLAKTKGAGRKIMEHLVKINPYQRLRLEAMPKTLTTEGNRAFYASLGFKRDTGTAARERERATEGLIPMVLRKQNKLTP